MTTPSDPATVPQRVESIVRALRARLGEGFDDAAIAAEVEAEFAAYSAARVTQYVPILVERRVRARLSGRAGRAARRVGTEEHVSPVSDRDREGVVELAEEIHHDHDRAPGRR